MTFFRGWSNCTRNRFARVAGKLPRWRESSSWFNAARVLSRHFIAGICARRRAGGHIRLSARRIGKSPNNVYFLLVYYDVDMQGPCSCFECVFMHACMHACMLVYLYVCMYVCVCVCVYTQSHIGTN